MDPCRSENAKVLDTPKMRYVEIRRSRQRAVIDDNKENSGATVFFYRSTTLAKEMCDFLFVESSAYNLFQCPFNLASAKRSRNNSHTRRLPQTWRSCTVARFRSKGDARQTHHFVRLFRASSLISYKYSVVTCAEQWRRAKESAPAKAPKTV
jgi:hypothetical protein